jgi:hypothetical protein
MSAKLLPFRERDGGLMRRYRLWRFAFGIRTNSRGEMGRVLGIERLKWQAYGEWRRRTAGLRRESVERKPTE